MLARPVFSRLFVIPKLKNSGDIYDGSTMLTVSGNSRAHLVNNVQEALSSRVNNANNPSRFAVCLSLPKNPLQSFSSCFSSRGCNQILRTHHISSKRWQCRLGAPVPDDEYRSSRNIATSLFKRYRTAVERGGGDNLKEFIKAGVNAYALGCTDEGLRDELIDMKKSGVEVEAMQGLGGRSTSLKSKIISEEINECILWLSIIFITILCTPQPTIVRWSSTPPVSDEILLNWKGFCALIANAYFVRGMAWLPVKTLQLEQMAVMGRTEEASIVASRMSLVFTTLEVVSPQWPRV